MRRGRTRGGSRPRSCRIAQGPSPRRRPRPRRFPLDPVPGSPGDDGDGIQPRRGRGVVQAAPMAASIVIRPVGDDELGPLLPLIAGYQRFYGVDAPDDERNRAFWARFTVPGGVRGLLLAALRDGAAVGFTTIYWTWESVAA